MENMEKAMEIELDLEQLRKVAGGRLDEDEKRELRMHVRRIKQNFKWTKDAYVKWCEDGYKFTDDELNYIKEIWDQV